MNKKHTLKELADIGLNAACQFEPNSSFPLSFQNYREAFTKAILDAIGYELPKDEEREAFERWYECAPTFGEAKEVIFAAWQAGREELRKAVPMFSFDKNITITPEPEWIPWHGGDKSPITGARTRYEIEYRDGAKTICTHNTLRWSHDNTAGDIIAYRIIY